MILPCFGMLNNFMTLMTAKVVFGASSMNLALVGITFLGFVVWAFHDWMGLPICKGRGINFAICWNALMVLGTRFVLTGKNPLNIGRSAGNLIHEYGGASETTRERCMPENFKAWFVGFCEGDAYLPCPKNKFQLILTQRNPEVLLYIQSHLNTGNLNPKLSASSVRTVKSTRQEKEEVTGHYRLVITSRKQVAELLPWFLQYSCLEKTQPLLQVWAEAFHSDLLTQSIPNTGVSLENAWVSGFTDAEGCFSIDLGRLRKQKMGFRISWSNKNEREFFEAFQSLLGTGSVTQNSGGQVRYYLQASHSLDEMTAYFERFPLHSCKNQSFQDWVETRAYCRRVPRGEWDFEWLTRQSRDLNHFAFQFIPVHTSR